MRPFDFAEVVVEYVRLGTENHSEDILQADWTGYTSTIIGLLM
jgi:hypothetical protein